MHEFKMKKPNQCKVSLRTPPTACKQAAGRNSTLSSATEELKRKGAAASPLNAEGCANIALEHSYPPLASQALPPVQATDANCLITAGCRRSTQTSLKAAQEICTNV